MAGEFTQTEVSPEIVTVGVAFTAIVTEPVSEAVHELKTEDVPLTSVYVLLAVNAGVVILANPFRSKSNDWLAPPSTVYNTVVFGVPENEMIAVFPLQIEVLPEMVTVGSGTMVSVTGVRVELRQLLVKL